MQKKYKSNDGNIISHENGYEMDCKLFLFKILFLIDN